MLIIRIISLATAVISLISGLIIAKTRKMPNYFYCFLMSIVAELLAFLYYLALEIDTTFNSLFTLGIFGEMAFYFFITAANTKDIPGTSTSKKKVCWPGLIVASLVSLILIISVILYPSIESIVSSILFLISIPNCVYSCAKVIEDRKNNEYKKSIVFFNVLAIIGSFTAVLEQILFIIIYLYGRTPIIRIAFYTNYSILTLVDFVMVFVLGKEVKSWVN